MRDGGSASFTRPPCLDAHGGHRGNMGPMATPLELRWSDADAEIHSTVVGPMDNNVYIVRCKATGDAVLIDAANEHDQLLDICRRLGVRSVVETHGHWDHIQAVPAMRDAGYEVAVTAADADMLFPGGPGNTSFPGGDFTTIIRSIEDRLLTLPVDTIVLPGHGTDTTVG